MNQQKREFLTKTIYDWNDNASNFDAEMAGWTHEKLCRDSLALHKEDFPNAKVFKITITIEELPNE